WALQTPVAAVIPSDRDAVERAIDAQRPVVLARRRRFPSLLRRPDAARALLELADLVHGEAIPRGVARPHRPRGSRTRGVARTESPQRSTPDRRAAGSRSGAMRSAAAMPDRGRRSRARPGPR